MTFSTYRFSPEKEKGFCRVPNEVFQEIRKKVFANLPDDRWHEQPYPVGNGEKKIVFWFVPTIHIEELKQKSISINKLTKAKNNWELLEKCHDRDFITKTLGIR